MRYFAETIPGIEDIAWLEIESRLPHPSFLGTLFVKEKRGIVLFEAGGETEKLAQLRTAVSVSAFAFSITKLERNTEDLRQITKLVSESPEFAVAINQAMQFSSNSKQPSIPTYRIYSHIAGKYPYHQGNLARAVTFGMEKRYPDWEKTSQKPRLEISIQALGAQILCGVRLTSPDMHTTYPNAIKLESELPPSVAAAMAQLSDPDEADIFLNPFTEDGVFLMERRLAGPYQQMFAFAPNRTANRLAKANMKNQRKETPHDTHIEKQELLDAALEANSINKVAVDMNLVKAPVSDFLAELARVLMENGRIVLFATNYDEVKKCVRQIPSLTITTGYSVYIHGKWGRIYVLTSQN